MKNDIRINPQDLSATLTFRVQDFKAANDYKDALAILFMVAGDYHLDPEVERKELEGFLAQAKEANKNALEFVIDEEGLELEFIDIKED